MIQKRLYRDIKIGDVLIKKDNQEFCKIKDFSFKFNKMRESEKTSRHSWIWIFGAIYKKNMFKKIFETFKGGFYIQVPDEIKE
jgi:hypothetical protein